MLQAGLRLPYSLLLVFCSRLLLFGRILRRASYWCSVGSYAAPRTGPYWYSVGPYTMPDTGVWCAASPWLVLTSRKRLRHGWYGHRVCCYAMTGADTRVLVGYAWIARRAVLSAYAGATRCPGTDVAGGATSADFETSELIASLESAVQIYPKSRPKRAQCRGVCLALTFVCCYEVPGTWLYETLRSLVPMGGVRWYETTRSFCTEMGSGGTRRRGSGEYGS